MDQKHCFRNYFKPLISKFNGGDCFVSGFPNFLCFLPLAPRACPFDRLYALKPKNPV